MNEKLQAAIKAAQEAITAGDLEAARKHREEAEGIKALIDESKKLSDLSASYQPLRPELPGTGAGAVVGEQATKSGERKPEDTERTVRGAAYVTRFGEANETVKRILVDLHGDHPEEAYFAQKAAFNRYLRGGEAQLTSQDRQVLGQMVLTPAVIKSHLEQGFDSVSAIRATMVEAADQLGGFMVPVDFQNKLIQQLARLTELRKRSTVISTNRDRVEMPEMTGADGVYSSPVRVGWVDETPSVGQLTSNNLTFGLRGIQVHTAMAEAYMSRNMLEDVAFDVEGYLSQKLAEAVALDEDKQFLVGDGTGKPRGILPRSVNTNGLRERLTGSSGAITWNSLIALTYSIPAQYKQNSVFLANRATYESIAKLQSNGQYLWQAYQFEGGTAGRESSLLGYPIVECEWMPDLAANSYPMLFGDLSAYTVVDRLGMSVERFIGATEARQNLVAFVMRRRLGGDLIETWRLSALKAA